MTLEEKIRRKLVEYYLHGRKETAFELGNFYFRLAKRKTGTERSAAACVEGLYWLKIAVGCALFNQVSPDLQRLKESLNKILERAG